MLTPRDFLVSVRRWFDITRAQAPEVNAAILDAHLSRFGYDVQPRDTTIEPEHLAELPTTVAVARFASPVGPVLVFVRHYKGQWWTIEATEPQPKR